MLDIVLLIVLIALVGLAVAIARQPNEFEISRSTLMQAPAAAIFALVNNLRCWDGWSPWAKLDPQAKNAFEGPESGAGAVMRWAGNNKVGQGSMTIIDSQPDSLIRLKLEFLKPFKGKSTAEFNFHPDGEQTTVTWRMHGENKLIGKAMNLVMNCDKMIGGQYEKGLANLKAIVESR